MKTCKYCQVKVETEKDFCPLCFNKLDDDGSQVETFYSSRTNNVNTKKKSKFLFKLFIFISFCVIAVCFTINFLTTPKILWSVVVFSGVIYIWVLVAHTILSKQSVFRKVFLQILSILLLLFFTEKLSQQNWLFDYVYPSISMAVVLTTLMLLFIKKNRNEYLIGFLFIYFILDLLSVLILLINKNCFLLLNFINILVCSISFLGVLFFGFNALKTEIKKKWHL